jgi:hypothetical protein
VDGALYVDPKHLDGFREPVVEDRAEMIDGVASLDGAIESSGISKVSLDLLDIQSVEVLCADPGFDESSDVNALLE